MLATERQQSANIARIVGIVGYCWLPAANADLDSKRGVVGYVGSFGGSDSEHPPRTKKGPTTPTRQHRG